MFNLAGMCAVATVGRQPLSSMFSGLSTVGPLPDTGSLTVGAVDMAGAQGISDCWLYGWWHACGWVRTRHSHNKDVIS